MLFFGVRKDAFNGLFPLLVKIPVLWCIAGVIRQVFVILPDMPLYGLYVVLGMRAKLSGGTIRTNSGVTLVFPVAVPVCGGIFQDLVFRANHTVIEFIIDILPPLVSPLHRLRALVSCRENSAVIKHLLADMGRLISGIRYNNFCFRKCFRYLVVYLIKSYAVMDIPGSDHRFQHKTVFVTGSMGFVSELTLVAALYEQAAVWVGHAFRNHTNLVFLPASQLLSGGVVLAFLWRYWRLVIERLLPMGFPVRVDLLHQFLGIMFGGHRYCGLYPFLCVSIRFDVGTVYKDRLGRQVSRLCHFLQDPCKNPVYRFCRKSVTEIITHRGKVRCFLLEGIAQKPTVGHVQIYFFRRPPQRRQSVQMLDQYHLEQHHRVYAGTSVILTIQCFHHFVDSVKIHRRVYFPQ